MRKLIILILAVVLTGCYQNAAKLPELQVGVVRSYIESFPVVLKCNSDKDFQQTNVMYFDSEKRLRKAFARNEVDIAVLPVNAVLDNPKNDPKILSYINNTGMAFAASDSISNIMDLKQKRIAVIDYHNLPNILDYVNNKYELNLDISVVRNHRNMSKKYKNKDIDVVFDVLPEIAARKVEGKNLFWLRDVELYASTCQILGNSSAYKLKRNLTALFLAQVYENVGDINSLPRLSYEALSKIYNLRDGYKKLVLRNTSYVYGLKPQLVRFDQEVINNSEKVDVDLNNFLHK
jgi:hypothetical protein